MGPYSDLRAYDVEPQDAGPNIRLIRRTRPIVGTSCYLLAIRSEGGWYVAEDAVGPCDTVADLPGDTIIASRHWRDVGVGRRQLFVEVAITKTTRDLRTESEVAVIRRAIRADVECTVQPAPPRCAPPVLYPGALHEIEDAPFDVLRRSPRTSVRAWLLARFAADPVPVCISWFPFPAAC